MSVRNHGSEEVPRGPEKKPKKERDQKLGFSAGQSRSTPYAAKGRKRGGDGRK